MHRQLALALFRRAGIENFTLLPEVQCAELHYNTLLLCPSTPAGSQERERGCLSTRAMASMAEAQQAYHAARPLQPIQPRPQVLHVEEERMLRLQEKRQQERPSMLRKLTTKASPVKRSLSSSDKGGTRISATGPTSAYAAAEEDRKAQ